MFRSFDIKEFEQYINSLCVKRKIERIQLHHTYSPDYSHFNGNNHVTLQQGMKNHHVKTNGWSDIAQHFTVFPDGIILSGRSLEKKPAGIYGANTGAICIECLGNFDEGADLMTTEQKNAIVRVVRLLLEKFDLSAEKCVTYHAWWTVDGKKLGNYIKGKSAKTCPGTAFFGGNTASAYEKNLMPLILADYTHEVSDTEDIIKILQEAGIITNPGLWENKCDADVNIYWLCRKMANRIRGVL